MMHIKDRTAEKSEFEPKMRQRRPKRVGIMGGTFNPIHIGHLIIAEDIREKACLDKVLFVPAGQPPHKPDSEVIDPEHRFEMVRRAVSSNCFFEASRMEIDRNGVTYTVNTLYELKNQYGDETIFYFIIGADIISELTAWREYEKVLQLCEFIAVLRPGYAQKEFENKIRRLVSDEGARIRPIQSVLIDISSTVIRENRMNGRSIKYLVPEEVERYIMKNGIYSGKS